MKQLVFLADIDVPGSPKVRDEINKLTIEEYAQSYASKSPMPPPHLFKIKEARTWWIADGRHRIEAFRTLGKRAMECETHAGTFDEALKFALGANNTHGLRRSLADKRRCVESALKQWPKQSDRDLGEMCQADHKTVGNIRSQMETKQVIAPTASRQGSDGRIRKTHGKSTPQVGSSPVEPKQVNKKSSSPVDATGYEIPKELLPLWRRSDEVKSMMGMVSDVKCALEKADKSGDELWRASFLNKAIASLSDAYGIIATALPFAVCSVCQGHPETQPKGQCAFCKGRGLVSKFLYDRVPDKIKALRVPPKT
jgi:hypothetical protein